MQNIFGGNDTKVEIVSKKQIRYEGILVSVNKQSQEIQLKNVKSFGTEGRCPGNEINPSFYNQDLIVAFQKSQIESVKFLDTNQSSEQEQNKNQENQPQQQQAQQPVQQQQQPQTNQNPPQQQVLPPQGFNPVIPGMMPVPQGFGGQQSMTMAQKKGQPVNRPEENSENIDFENMNDNFQRLEISKEKEENFQKKQYNKGGFFDSISNTVDTKSQRETREERQAQKQVDKDTFGDQSVNQLNHQHFIEMKRKQHRFNNNNRNFNNNYRNNQNNNYRNNNYRNNNRNQNNYQGGYNNNNYNRNNNYNNRGMKNNYNNNNNNNYHNNNKQGGYKNNNYNSNYRNQNNNRNYNNNYQQKNNDQNNQQQNQQPRQDDKQQQKEEVKE